MIKTLFRSPAFTAVLFIAAALLLVGGTIGATQAAPRIASGDYRAQVELTDIQTALVENGTQKSGDDALLQDMLKNAGDTSLKLGKSYDDKLAVRNVGNIDEYVRVTVTKYWTDAEGKQLTLDPSLIKLTWGTKAGWSIDEDASTPERTVLYYSKKLAVGDDTKPFVTKVTIDSDVVRQVTGEEYDYEGMKFVVEAKVDAVQTHNGEAAMTSAWGRTNKA